MRGNGTLNGKNSEGRCGWFGRENRCGGCIKLTRRLLRKAAHNPPISGLWLLIFKRAKYGERFVNIILNYHCYFLLLLLLACLDIVIILLSSCQKTHVIKIHNIFHNI